MHLSGKKFHSEQKNTKKNNLTISVFGRMIPVDVVHDYLLSMNEAELQKALSKRRLVTGCIVTVLIGMLIVFLSFRIHLAQLIKQAEETVIETRVIYIDHESGSE